MTKTARADIVLVMQGVIDGDIQAEEIPKLGTRQHRVAAAVAYMLLHRLEVDDNNHVQAGYGRLLMSLTKDNGTPDVFTTASRTLGLHISAPRQKVILTPPAELRLPVATTPVATPPEATAQQAAILVDPTDQRRAEEIVAELMRAETEGTVLAVSLLLRGAYGLNAE